MMLQEWYSAQLTELAEFVRYWDTKCQDFPGLFPCKLLAGDWGEQFNFFVEQE